MSGLATATIAAGALGAGASLSSANKAGKASKEAANRQEQMSAKELAFRQAMFDYEKQMTQPLRQKLTDEAMSSEPLDYAGTSAKIKQGYGEARRRLAEQGYGTGTAGTGLGATNAQALDLGEASDLAGAWAQGMSAKRGLGTQLLGYGNYTGAQQGLAGAMQGQANLYGQQASQYGQAAQQGWANAGNAISGVVRDLGRINYGSSEQSVTPAMVDSARRLNYGYSSGYDKPLPVDITPIDTSKLPTISGAGVLAYQPNTGYHNVED